MHHTIFPLKYTIDTPENRQFLSEIRDTLFSFGRQFPSPGGGSYYLGDDGTPPAGTEFDHVYLTPFGSLQLPRGTSPRRGAGAERPRIWRLKIVPVSLSQG